MPQRLNQALLRQSTNVVTGVQLNATPTGSVATSVLRFNTVTTTGRFTISTTAAEGTIITVNEPGVYGISLGVDLQGPNPIDVGFGLNVPAGFAGDPTFNNSGIIRAHHGLAAAATQVPIEMATQFYVGGADAGTMTVKFCASNQAGAAPDPGDLIATTAQFRIVQLASVAF